MEGRSTEQKAVLSKRIVSELKVMFPEVPIISINIRDFERATYCNKSMV
jgi:5-carboxymethyl-2-hydroxymuconate isomerase